MNDTAPRRATTARAHGSLLVNVIEFSRLLHANGIFVAPGSATIAIKALREIDLTQRVIFRTTLRITFLKKPEDIPFFTSLFNAYWSADGDLRATRDDDSGYQQSQTTPQTDPDDPGNERLLADTPEEKSGLEDTTVDTSEQFAQAARWSVGETQRARKQHHYDARELDRIARALVAELAVRRSRRTEPYGRGKLLDYRSTMRKSIRYGGLPLVLSRRRHQITRARVILLCDVSRSMEPYATLLLHFAAAMSRQAWRVEVFTFASSLVRVTEHWLNTEFSGLINQATSVGGGTQIGLSLETFLDHYEYCLTGNKSTVIMLSDGLDAGEPDALGHAMARLQRHSRHLIWLNPLFATSGYEPTARGMAVALPFTDVFAPAHDVSSLWQMIYQLRNN